MTQPCLQSSSLAQLWELPWELPWELAWVRLELQSSSLALP